MIIIINAKDFARKPKKLIALRDYHLFNGSTNDRIQSISEGSDIITDLQPTRGIFEEKLSSDEKSAKVKKFIKGEGLTMVCARAVAQQLKDPDSNIYIILSKKVYEALADKLVKRFNKIIDIDEGDLVVKYTDYDLICEWYRKHVSRELDKYNEKYDKVKNSDKKLSDKSDKLSDLNARLDNLEDAYESPDKLKARKEFLKEAEFSKKTAKKMKKFLADRKEDLLAIESRRSDGIDFSQYTD